MNNTILEHIVQNPVIPVYYNDDEATCIDILISCYQGGIRVFEFTDRGVNALTNFKAMLNYRDKHLPGLILGIGTIKTAEKAEQYINLNADFIVSPIVKPEIAAITAKHNVFWIPGCMTPTEISVADELGAQLIKLFPGDVLGAGFLKAIKPLFPSLKFMPTGGVSLEDQNVNNWLKAGATALGLGSKLFDQPADAVGYDWLSKRCRELFKLVSDFK
ncbi:2-dehydro-3-deoxyphosphogluconate aldolase/(4S)-4-hydroxy-2-oxoglutarate aldolase [Pedobacter sp. UYP24]